MKIRPIQRFPTRRHPSLAEPARPPPSLRIYGDHLHKGHLNSIMTSDSLDQSSESDGEEVYDMTNLSIADIEDIEHTIAMLQSKSDMDTVGWMSPLKKYYKSPRNKETSNKAFTFPEDQVETPKKPHSPPKEASSTNNHHFYSPEASSSSSSNSSNMHAHNPAQEEYHQHKAKQDRVSRMRTIAKEHVTNDDNLQPLSASHNPQHSHQFLASKPPHYKPDINKSQVNEMWSQFESMFEEDDIDLNAIRDSKKALPVAGQENANIFATKSTLKQFLASPMALSHEPSLFSHSLPPMIIEKLKQAEKQLEMELTKDRQRALSKLQQILLIGKQAYLDEVNHKSLQHWDQQERSIVLHQLHDEVVTEAKTSFGGLPASAGMQSQHASNMKLSSDRAMYIQLLIKQLKAKKQEELNNELKLVTSQLAKVTSKQMEERNRLQITTMNQSQTISESEQDQR